MVCLPLPRVRNALGSLLCISGGTNTDSHLNTKKSFFSLKSLHGMSNMFQADRVGT